MSDTELRRRHPDLKLPPLHRDGEAERSGIEAGPDQAEPEAAEIRVDGEPDTFPQATAKLDIKAALASARKAQQILAERDRQADKAAELDSGDVARRRDAEARQEADTRRGAVRQEPAPSRQAMTLELDELELEAGH